jgi:HK97 family phage major capsid protein
MADDDNTTSTLDIEEGLIGGGGKSLLNAVKILKQDEATATVGGYGVVFGGKDLEKETFTRSTDYMLDLVPTKLVFYEHTQRPDIGHQIGTVKNENVSPDETGLWIQGELDKSAGYVDAVLKLIEKGALGWSSGSVAHLARRKNGVIKTWPIVEFSLTPTPAEPRTLGVELIKKMAETNPEFKAFLLEDGQETIDEDANKGAGEANVSESLDSEKEDNMSETQDAPVLTADAIAEAMGAQLKESFEPVIKRLEVLEKAQPLDDGGTDVKVVADEEDKALPFKSFGEFAQLLARNDRDQRLRAVRSEGDGMGGYFDIGKALGSDFVGNMGPATKAPTGLQEGIPSAGGFLVGTDRAAGLLSRVYNVGQLLQRTDMVGISANSNGMTFYAEDETSRVDGSRRGGILAYWAAEAEEKTKSKPKFREMELKLRKAIGLVYATDELLADADALQSWIMQNLPEELSFVVENSVINGTGVGMPLGILNSAAPVSIAKETGQAAATIVAENIDKMWARRWIGGRNYAWFVNQDTGPALATLNRAVGTGGALVYSPPGGLSQAPYGSLKGAPVFEIEYAATLGTVGDIMLLDLSQYQMINKGGVQSDSSIHVRFVYDETVFRFVYRVDGQPKWDSALTPFKALPEPLQLTF